MSQRKKPVVTPVPATAKAWLNPAVVQLEADAEPLLPESIEPDPTTEPPALAPAPIRHRRQRLIIGSVIGLAIAGISSASIYLDTHSLVPVQVASLAPTHSAAGAHEASQLSAAARGYRLAIKAPDGTVSKYSLRDMGLSPDIAATLANAKGQHGLAFWHTSHIALVLKTSQAKFVPFLHDHTALAATPATDAGLAITDGKVTITPEANGKGYRIANAPQTVLASAGNLSPQPLPLTAGSIAPYIKSANLQQPQALLAKVVAQKIGLTIAGSTIVPSASDIASWVTLTPNIVTGSVDVSVNNDAVKTYVDNQTAAYVNAPADTVTPQGGDGTISIVEQRGGGSVVDKSTLVANLADRLLGADGQQLAVSITGAVSKTVTAYAQPKWLLVNLATHRMYAYQDTTLVRTFLISAGKAGTPTVQGTYKIYAKYASQDMRGANADGTDYFQPNVQYVNYFYKDYAVHGNYWRPLSYFGNIDSSHGCVGVVNSDAKWIYSWAPIGTTVLVHA